MWIPLLSIFASVTVQAATAGFCGSLDLKHLRNFEIENIVFAATAKYGQLNKVQCGLPGEKLAICSACANDSAPQSMNTLRAILANEGHVAWHVNWHNLRGTSIDEETFKKGRREGWIPQTVKYDEFLQKHVVGGTSSGEDFFAMHRLMIKMVQIELAAANLPCFAPWEELPTIDDAQWPIPRDLNMPERRQSAEAQWADVKQQLQKYSNPTLLKKVSLNRLGQLIEPALHQTMHNLYRSVPVCSSEAKAQNLCDDLIPVDTSPLNKHFWKIHGLIDSYIGKWLEANGYDEIAVHCDDRPRCYQWDKAWSSKTVK